MKRRHNLYLVRYFYGDGTYHCAKHGRLSDEEAAEALHRARLDDGSVVRLDSVPIGIFWRIRDALGRRLVAVRPNPCPAWSE